MYTTITRLTFFLVLILMISCDKKASDTPELQSITLLPWMESDVSKNTTLTIEVPSSWIINKDEKDMVTFRPADLGEKSSLGLFNVNLFSCPEALPASGCIDKWVERHFYEIAADTLQREEVGKDRVWIIAPAGKDGKGLSARYYVAGEEKLAVANFRLGQETLSYLPAFKKAGGTLTFTDGK